MERFKKAGAARLRPVLQHATDPAREEYDSDALSALDIRLSPNSIVNPRPAERHVLKQDLSAARDHHYSDETVVDSLSPPRRKRYWQSGVSKHSAYTWARLFARTLAAFPPHDDAALLAENGGYPPQAGVHSLDAGDPFEQYLATGATTGCGWRATKWLSCGDYHGCVLTEETNQPVLEDRLLRGEVNCIAAMFSTMFLHRGPSSGKPELPRPITIITFTKSTVRVIQARMSGGPADTSFPISVHIPLQMPILKIFYPGKNAQRAWESLVAWGRFYVSAEEHCGACVLRELEIAAGGAQESPSCDGHDDLDDDGEVAETDLGGEYEVFDAPEISSGWVSDLPDVEVRSVEGEWEHAGGWQEIIGQEETKGGVGHQSMLSWICRGFIKTV